MAEKFRQQCFGTCPRVQCNRQPLLPIGQSDRGQKFSVKLYCGKCNDIFSPEPKPDSLDGAYFGTAFAHMFFMQFPDLIPASSANGIGEAGAAAVFQALEKNTTLQLLKLWSNCAAAQRVVHVALLFLSHICVSFCFDWPLVKAVL